jgi:hypothetical protein
MYFIFFLFSSHCGIDTLWAAPVESMGKEVLKGGGDLSDLLKVDTIVVFSCIIIYDEEPNIY